MKVKVDGITYKEFVEYVNSSFAKQINMTLYILLAIISLVIAGGLLSEMDEAALKPVFLCELVLIVLIVSSKAGMNFMFKKSGLKDIRCRYSFDAYGMDIVMGKLSGDLDWEHVKRVTETDNLWVIRVDNGQFILPKRCCDNDLLRELISSSVSKDKIKNKEDKRGKDRRERSATSKRDNGTSETTE